MSGVGVACEVENTPHFFYLYSGSHPGGHRPARGSQHISKCSARFKTQKCLFKTASQQQSLVLEVFA